MRILHLVSNWKLTGSVAPALELAGALRARGHEVHAAVGRPIQNEDNHAGNHARSVGLKVVGDLTLSKHFRFLDNFRDVRRLRKIILEEEYDLIHVHGTNDHLLASVVRRNLRQGGIVRSFYCGDLTRLRRRDHLLTMRAADALLVPSVSEEAWARQIRPDLDERTLIRLPGAVDLNRFDPGRFPRASRTAGVFRVGIVARVQIHRRWEDILEAVRMLAGSVPEVRLVVVGRGTHYDRLLRTPVCEKGIEDRVELAGYLKGDEYVRMLSGLGAALYLVPGSDGTCRAVRELMAMRLPLVVSRAGMLPELVEMGRSGMLLDGPGPEPLAEAIKRLSRNPDLCSRLGKAALARARRDFNLENYAERVESMYGHILAKADKG